MNPGLSMKLFFGFNDAELGRILVLALSCLQPLSPALDKTYNLKYVGLA